MIDFVLAAEAEVAQAPPLHRVKHDVHVLRLFCSPTTPLSTSLSLCLSVYLLEASQTLQGKGRWIVPRFNSIHAFLYFNFPGLSLERVEGG